MEIAQQQTESAAVEPSPAVAAGDEAEARPNPAVLVAAAASEAAVMSPRFFASHTKSMDQSRKLPHKAANPLRDVGSPHFTLDSPDAGPAEDPRAALLYAQISNEQFFEIVDFILALTSSLHKYGMPTHRLEFQIAWVAERFGIHAVSAVFPTYITVSFKRANDPHTSFTYNLAVEYSWDLENLELADALAMAVASHKLSLDEGIAELRNIQQRKSRYQWWTKLVAMGLMSFVLTPLFYGGGVIEACVSMVLGLIVDGFLMIGERSTAFNRMVDPLSAIMCSLVATILERARIFGPIYGRPIMLGGMIWSLPGLQINTAMSDLSTHMFVSGTSRLVYAMLVIFELAFGMVIGIKLGELVPSAAVVASSSSLSTVVVPTIKFSPWLGFLWVPIAAITLGLMLGAAPKQYPPIIVAAACATTQSLMTATFGNEFATMIAQFAVVVTGNIFARIFDRPAFISTVIGSLMMMPSSLGVRGVSGAVLSSDTALISTFAFNMLITAVSMVVGGYIANVVLYPKRAF